MLPEPLQSISSLVLQCECSANANGGDGGDGSVGAVGGGGLFISVNPPGEQRSSEIFVFKH